MPEPGRVLSRPEIEAMMRSEFLPSAFVVGALARSHEQLREALEWYADERNWTQTTSWGGLLHDPEGEATRDGGNRARAAFSAGEETP